MKLASAVIISRQIQYLATLLVSILGINIAGMTPSAAVDDEVECKSIKIQMEDSDYDTICSAQNVSDVTVETLEANSADGSHFLVVADLHTNYGYIFETRGLRESLADLFSELSFANWHVGKSEQGLTTSEFDSSYKTIPSGCVGFQKYVAREQFGGWRRHIVGFACSRNGDREQVYNSLKLIDFP